MPTTAAPPAPAARSPRRALRLGRLAALIGAAALCAGAVFGLHQFQVRRQSTVYLARGAELAAAGKFPEASAQYQAYLKVRPKDPAALAPYAATLDELAKARPQVASKAVEVYEELNRQGLLTEDQRARLARHDLTLELPAAARDVLRPLNILERTPLSLDWLDLLIDCAEQERKYPEAADLYRRALATNEAPAATYQRFALMLRRQVGTAEARDEAERVMAGLVRARPADVAARLARATVAIASDDLKLARAEAEFAYKSIPGGADDADVGLMLAVLATGPGDLPLAQEALARAAKARPADGRLPLALSELQLRAQNPEAARATLLGAAKTAPPGRDLLTVGERLIDLGERAAARTVAARLAESPGFGAATQYLAGRASLADGRPAEATPALEKAVVGLKRTPDLLASCYAALAECRRQAGDRAGAKEALDLAVRADPNSAPARLGQAREFARQKQFAPAVALYQALAPSSPQARFELCELRLNEQLARPQSERQYRLVEDAAGPPPRAPELEVLLANVLRLEGKQAEALAALRALIRRPDAKPLAGLRLALAYAEAASDPGAALKTLETAANELGDKADFRLARATVLSRLPSPDAGAVAKLAESTGGFDPADRARLLTGVAGLLVSLGDGPGALRLYRAAFADLPADRELRLTALELALRGNDARAADEIVAQLDALDGPAGPGRVIAGVMRDLAAGPPDAGKLAEMRDRMADLVRAHPAETSAVLLLAALEAQTGRAESAAAHYRAAFEAGARGANVVRPFVQLLLANRGQLEALELLTRLDRAAPLPPDLAQQLVLLRTVYGEETGRNLAWARSPGVANSGDWREQAARAAVLGGSRAWPEARTAAERAVSLAGSEADVWLLYVQILVAADARPDARGALDAAAKQLPRAGPPPLVAKNALALAHMHELAGAPADAEPFYREALAAAPGDPAVAGDWARFLKSTGRAAEAVALYDRLQATAADPEERRAARRNLALELAAASAAPANFGRAVSLIDANLADGNLLADRRAKSLILATDPLRLAAAAAELAESAKEAPLSPEEAFYLAQMQSQLGRLDRAEELLSGVTRAGVGAAPEHLVALARVQLARGAAGRASQTAARLESAAPRSFDALAAKARVLASAGGRDAAGQLLRANRFLADGAPGDLAKLAALTEELDFAAEAEELFRRLDSPQNPAGHVPLASFYLRSRRPVEAAKLALGRGNAPAALTAKLLAAALHYWPEGRAGDLAPVEEFISRKRAVDPDSPDIQLASAELLLAKRDPAGAIQGYERLLDRAPDSEAALNNLAWLLAVSRPDSAARALELAERLVATRGPTPSNLDTRGRAYLAAGKLAEARRDLAASDAARPSAVTAFHLALAAAAEPPMPAGLAARKALVESLPGRGLKREGLNYLEWPDYDRLVGAGK